MIGLGVVYAVAAVAFAGFALAAAREGRWANAGFHGLLALSFVAGDRIGDAGMGVVALALVALATSGRMRRGPAFVTAVSDHRAPLLLLALIVPAVALVGTLVARRLPGIVDPKQATLVSLAAGVIVALAVAAFVLRASPITAMRAGGRLADDIGWAIALPQFLASLGAVFAAAGVGGVVGGLVTAVIPAGSLVGAIAAYGLGMALFTMLMGNAFAAFPVMAAAIGMPILVRAHGGDPAPVAAIGMLCGFCGTLLTPMAANFNIVPAALLDLSDRYGVIRAQVATALPLLAVNMGILWWVLR